MKITRIKCEFLGILDNELADKKRQLEAADIKEVMRAYGGEDSEQQKSIGEWLVSYAENRQQLDPIELKHAYNEVDDIARGAYNWKIDSAQQGLQ